MTFEQKLEVLNNEENFIGLTKTANTSKGAKSYIDWEKCKKLNIEVDPVFRENMIKAEKSLEKILQAQIDNFNNTKF